jgi:hypothetical protein
MFQLCFNLIKIHDCFIGKALRTAKQGRATANSHAVVSSNEINVLRYCI